MESKGLGDWSVVAQSVRLLARAAVLLRVNPAVRLHWRRWDCDWLVFDAASGNTHQMAELTACALLCLEEGAMHDEALVAEVSAATMLPEDAIRVALQDAIAQLTRLGLVDIVPA